jgi:membrane protease YdiL (CAAX protease family)
MGYVVRLFRFFTIHQYEKIDEELLTEERPDWKMAVTLVSIAVCMLLPAYFGKSSHLVKWEWAVDIYREWPHPSLYPRMYWGLFKIVNYLVVPSLVIKLVFRDRIRDYGFKLSTDKRVLGLYLLMFVVVMPLVWYVSDAPAFLGKYPKYKHAAQSYYQLGLWEATYGVQFFMLEFFFRGYALFAMARYVGHVAIYIMVIPYCMIHLAKPLPETLGSIITGIALGTLALRTRSIYGGVLIHMAVAWSMDFFAMWHKGQLQKLFSSGGG